MQNLVEPFTHQSTDKIGIFLNPIASRFSGDYDGMTQQADGSYAAKWGSQRGIVYRSDMKPGKEGLFLGFFSMFFRISVHLPTAAALQLTTSLSSIQEQVVTQISSLFGALSKPPPSWSREPCDALRCPDGRLWPAPGCRNDLTKCIPVITAFGWKLQAIMQWSLGWCWKWNLGTCTINLSRGGFALAVVSETTSKRILHMIIVNPSKRGDPVVHSVVSLASGRPPTIFQQPLGCPTLTPLGGQNSPASFGNCKVAAAQGYSWCSLEQVPFLDMQTCLECRNWRV